MSIPGIGPISAAVIYAEYGDISNFSSPAQMLAFAGIEPSVNDSGTESHGGKMVRHGSSPLRYVLLNCCLPLIRFDMTFATYYAKKRHLHFKRQVLFPVISILPSAYVIHDYFSEIIRVI